MPDLFGITKYTLTLLYDRSHNSYIKFLSISIDNFNMDMQEIERGGGARLIPLQAGALVDCSISV